MNRNAFVLTAMFHWSVMTIGSAGLSLNPAIRSASWLLAAFALAAIISIRNCQISSSLTSITRRRLSRMSWITNPRQSVRQMKRPCAAGRPSFYRRPRISRPCCAVVRNVHILCLVHLCWSSSAKQNAAGHLLSCLCSVPHIFILPPGLPVVLAVEMVCSLYQKKGVLPML